MASCMGILIDRPMRPETTLCSSPDGSQVLAYLTDADAVGCLDCIELLAQSVDDQLRGAKHITAEGRRTVCGLDMADGMQATHVARWATCQACRERV